MSKILGESGQSAPVMWMQNADAGCGSCAGEATQDQCPTAFEAPRCAQPALRGDAKVLSRILNALRTVGDVALGHNIVDDQHIRSLDIDADEASLALTFQSACGMHQHISEAAFQVLRRELPDTDIYVTHAR